MSTLRKITAVIALSVSSFAHGANYQDWWWNSDLSGMGVNVGHQGNIVAAAWYFFDSDASPTYLMLTGTLSNDQVSGALQRAMGPQPGIGYDKSLVTRENVGTATLKFNSPDSATLTYSYGALSGTINLSRYSFMTPSVNGTWTFTYTAKVSNCDDSSENGVESGGNTAEIVKTSSQLQIQTLQDGVDGACTVIVPIRDAGSVFYGDGWGSLSCTNGDAGSLRVTEGRILDDTMVITGALQYSSGGCKENTTWSFVKLPD